MPARAPRPEDSTSPIGKFRGPWRFLSNFWMVEVTVDGLTYCCAEAAYQAAKCARVEDRVAFTTLRGFDAKALGRTVPLPPDWSTRRVDVMRAVLRAKFDQHPTLAAWLVRSHPRLLAEGNTWGDRFWGVVDGDGENVLGRLLMELRDHYRQPGTLGGSSK